MVNMKELEESKLKEKGTRGIRPFVYDCAVAAATAIAACIQQQCAAAAGVLPPSSEQSILITIGVQQCTVEALSCASTTLYSYTVQLYSC